ncbi:MAG: hypothetical protein ACKVS9_02240 [Phycisphaerae bacterium]
MSTRGMRRLIVGSAPIALSATALAAVVVDGQNIPTDFGASALQATQVWQTGFGNDNDTTQFGGGSELNRMYLSNDGTNLYLGITGNLENNGNCVIVFIDANGTGVTDGASPLLTQNFGQPVGGLPRNLHGIPFGQGFNGFTFDTGFSPTNGLVWSGGSPVGSQIRTYYAVNWIDFADVNGADPFGHVNTVAGIMTAGDATASGSAGTLGSFLSTGSTGILAAADNSGNQGVDGAFPSGPWTTDPATATTGFEFAIPLSLLGVSDGDEICLLAIVSGDNGYKSNQLLPAPADASLTEFNNLGSVADFSDFNNLVGNQYLCYTLASAGCPGGNACDSGDVNSDCVVNLTDLATLLANFGIASGATRAQGDLSGDGAVLLNDLAQLLSVFGANCQ